MGKTDLRSRVLEPIQKLPEQLKKVNSFVFWHRQDGTAQVQARTTLSDLPATLRGSLIALSTSDTRRNP